ncbi:MAG: hypothetical protein JWM87_4060, partial [Candidatus Eremiobacteraeota bacterium]|nr:hypothetical protein [Candidatus Eremiobacteraeota bacterium]
MPGIYVETFVRADPARVIDATQVPELHRRWDLRFTEIAYLPREDGHDQRFLYATRIGFGLEIRGFGETTGSVSQPDGTHVSGLRFWSDDPRSLIRTGSGYWRYVPQDGGMRFLTFYDYGTRFGAAGAAFDRTVFRPLLGWATAWSFDALRLWLERGIEPERSKRHALLRAATCAVAVAATAGALAARRRDRK